MKKDIIQIIKVTTIALALTLGVNYVMAWTGPTQAPPDGNVSAPVNIGAVSQIKNGGLGLNALSVFGNSFFQGTLGIGDTTPDGGLKLDVNGNIGADGYCDSNGDNCTAATALGSGGGETDTNASTICNGTNVYLDGDGNCDTISGGGITGSGTTGYIPKWTGGTSLGNSQIFDNGTNVGIGKAAPISKLDVVGDIRGSQDLWLTGNMVHLGGSEAGFYGDLGTVATRSVLGLRVQSPNGTEGRDVHANDYYIAKTGKWASTLGGGGTVSINAYSCPLKYTCDNGTVIAGTWASFGCQGQISQLPYCTNFWYNAGNKSCNNSCASLGKMLVQ